MRKIIKRRSGVSDTSSTSGNESDIVKRVLSGRGCREGETQYALNKLSAPKQMSGLPEAINILISALKERQRILIVGDFDADGATSTTVAVKSLKMFGCQTVEYLVPNRFDYGYGLTPEIVDVAKELSPGLIITVDNGISSIEGVAQAKRYGIKVIVTDHHLPGQVLPDADAIVNPNLKDCLFPSKNLAGVGVIFYVMSALRTALKELGWFDKQNIPVPNMATLLDFVALGTVADVVPLDYNNRILVSQGLARMRAGAGAPGINALLKVGNRNLSSLVASDLGFAAGPRLNAAGRLDDMSLGIKCLLSENVAEAEKYAEELDDLNKDRKLIEASIQSEALRVLESINEDDINSLPVGVSLYREGWHQGVIGIVASRIKDKLHRPTIVFADAENGEIKGSGRSIPGVHLRDVLDEVATRNPGLLNKFGGHAMAAGLSIERSRLSDFQVAFDEVVQQQVDQEGLTPVLYTDGELSENFLTMQMAETLRNLGPWGQGFPEPCFDGLFHLVQQKIVGGKHLKMVLSPIQLSSKLIDAIAFNVDLEAWPDSKVERVKVVYKLDVNEFRGNKNLQFMVDYIEPAQ